MPVRILLPILLALLVCLGCSGGTMHLDSDTAPPVFNGEAGIQYVQPSDGEVTIYFNSAVDALSPPVSYVVYYDTVSPIRYQSGAVRLLVTAYPVYGAGPFAMGCDVTGLTNDVTYWFSVRAVDSALPANEDGNTVELLSTPSEPLGAAN